MKKITKILLATISVTIVGVLILNEKFAFFNYPDIKNLEAQSIKTTVLPSKNVPTSLRIAACPSFHHLLEKLEDREEIVTIRTRATGESLNLLRDNKTDFIISGRALKETEPALNHKILGHGYDFVFKEEVVIIEEELPLIKFYTNLPKGEVTKDFTQIPEKNITKVDKIEEYLNKGIIITQFENQIVGEVAHIMQEKGGRIALSRLPRLYYHPQTAEVFNEDELFKLLTE